MKRLVRYCTLGSPPLIVFSFYVGACIWLGLMISSCLTTQEKEVKSKYEAAAAKEKADVDKTTPGTPEHEKELSEYNKVMEELTVIRAELKLRQRDRGIEIASWAVGSLQGVVPFLPPPFGQAAAFGLPLLAAAIESLRRKGENGHASLTPAPLA